MKPSCIAGRSVSQELVRNSRRSPVRCSIMTLKRPVIGAVHLESSSITLEYFLLLNQRDVAVVIGFPLSVSFITRRIMQLCFSFLTVLLIPIGLSVGACFFRPHLSFRVK